MSDRLVDLDELVLRCRGARARAYIAEAVACYRAGAFRSGVVATWVAVTFDLIDKLRELALTGDRQAEALVESFDRIREADDVGAALQFERELLDRAKEEFELLSPVEYDQLARLRQDRNRCAHPSMLSAEEVYTPTAELVRVHIRAAVEYLLQRQPVQGKAALARLQAQVDSPYFPQTEAEAQRQFAHGPLARPRDSLVRNFALGLTKVLLQFEPGYPARLRYFAALNALREMHRPAVERALSERLSDIVRHLPADSLRHVVNILHNVPDLLQFLSGDVQELLQRYVRQMPRDDLMGYLETALKTPELHDEAAHRVANATEEEIETELIFDTHPVINDRRIAIYAGSRSFSQANKRAARLHAIAGRLTPTQVEIIVRAAASNGEIRGSFEFGTLLGVIRQASVVPSDVLDGTLRAAGLDAFAAGEAG